jgi:glycosyltransferase involved in cell wall biosynthesis
MEAMAAGLVVLARYDDNLQGTISDGKTGYFFYDEEDFKEKLANVIALSPASQKDDSSERLSKRSMSIRWNISIKT